MTLHQYYRKKWLVEITATEDEPTTMAGQEHKDVTGAIAAIDLLGLQAGGNGN